MRGWIDRISAEGVVEGWCWNPGSPESRINVAIMVDGEQVGETSACQYRKDLQDAGMGDGCHMFRYALPLGRLHGSRSLSVTMCEAETGQPIGNAFEYRSRDTATFDDRLSGVEKRAALLEGRLSEMRGIQFSEIATAELFAVVGSFFQGLSRDIIEGKALKPERRLGDSIRALARVYQPISFPPKQNPSVSILVEGGHPLSHLHACLQALKHASSKVDVQVTILDTGICEELTLLPSLIQGVRYIRTSKDLVAEWMEAERDTNDETLLFLSGQVVVDEDFLLVLLRWFKLHPRTGAIGGCAWHSDGALRHGGLCLFDDALGDCARFGHPDKRIDVTICHPVHALSSQVVAFRRRAFRDAGGLDPAFCEDLGAAVIDLCFRLRRAGWTVVSEPRARVGLPQDARQAWQTPTLLEHQRTRDLLFERWMKPSAQRTPLVAGVATVVAQPDNFDDVLEAVRRLRDDGFAVTYVTGEQPIEAGHAESLRNAGSSSTPVQPEGAGFAPEVIFFARDRIPVSALNVNTKDAAVVVGLSELESYLHYRRVHSESN